MKKFTWIFIFAITALTNASPSSDTVGVLKQFVASKDYLGLRVYLRRLSRSKKLGAQTWVDTRAFLVDNLPFAGYDALYAWDKIVPRQLETRRVQAVKKYLTSADNLLLEKNYSAAFDTYQKVAQSLNADIHGKDLVVAKSAENLYPYVLEGMGRSLYGMGNFPDSAEVFGWIPPTYPRYRRALFESMWASFQAGRADEALGRIAAQFSNFFTEFHYPEAYLMQAYVYKKLCRLDELALVIKKMKVLRDDVKTGRFTWRDWMKTDIEGFVLAKILETQPKALLPEVTADERAIERRNIETALQRAFNAEKALWLGNMDTAIAFAQLSTGNTSKLKPIAKLPSREDLFKMKLEIWPADDREEWIDELGSHRFVGESKCAMR